MSDYVGKTDVEFYAVEGPTRFLMSCRPCEGTGKQVQFMNDDLSPIAYYDAECRVCSGRSVARFESRDVPLVHTACRGTGRQFHRSTGYELLAFGFALEHPDYCLGCKGYGIVSLTGQITKLSGNPYHERLVAEMSPAKRVGDYVDGDHIRWLEEKTGHRIPRRDRGEPWENIRS